MPIDTVVRTFYQAAADARLWEPALEQWRRVSRTQATSFMLYRGLEAVGVHATAAVRDVVQTFVAERHWETNERIRHFMHMPLRDFVVADHYFPEEMLAQDSVARMLAARGLRQEVGTIERLSGDAIAVFVAERHVDAPAFSAKDLASLNRLRGHLIGAAQLAEYLGQERAAQRTQVLQVVGQAAAVLNGAGALMHCNPAFESGLADWAELDARHRLRPFDGDARRGFDTALARTGLADPAPAPIRLRARTGEALTLQVLPLLGAAQDRLFGGHALVTVQAAAAAPLRPATPHSLQQRYGLKRNEAELARLLATGLPLRQAAARIGITYATARTYLDRVYDKTGAHRQPELVRLVLGADDALH